jgi:phage shock protein PspC (stress-responsive transcriptional regulator)
MVCATNSKDAVAITIAIAITIAVAVYIIVNLCLNSYFVNNNA